MSKAGTIGETMDNILCEDINKAISYYRQYKRECPHADANISYMAGYYDKKAEDRVRFLINYGK